MQMSFKKIVEGVFIESLKFFEKNLCHSTNLQFF